MRSDVHRLLELTEMLAGLAVTTATADTGAAARAGRGGSSARSRRRVPEIGGERGTPGEGGTWVTARRPTGRPVASDERTFTDPVLNDSGRLDWIWEEPAFAAPQRIVLEATPAPDVPRHGKEALADPDPAEERA